MKIERTELYFHYLGFQFIQDCKHGENLMEFFFFSPIFFPYFKSLKCHYETFGSLLYLLKMKLRDQNKTNKKLT